MVRAALAVILSLVVAGCTREAPVTVAVPIPPTPRVQAIEPWALPATAASLPDLRTAPNGTLLLSWIEAHERGRALRFARHDARGWSHAPSPGAFMYGNVRYRW